MNALVKTLKALLITAVFLLILVLLFAVKNIEFSTEQGDRPLTVPEEAVWVGGNDGGVYLMLKPQNSPSDIYHAEVYYHEGSIAFKGALQLKGDFSENFNYKDSTAFSSWDGDTLYLRDGRRMIIVE